MRRLVVLALVACVAAPAIAQTVSFPTAVRLGTSPDPDALQIIHVTDLLLNRPEGQEALANYHRRKDLGLLPGARKQSASIGANQAFSVYNFLTKTHASFDFTLRAESQRFNIWVETTELNNGRVRDQDVELLRESLADRTPVGSVNPNRGIIANDEEVFGHPPNVDGDSRTDILVMNIRDTFDPNAGQLGAVLGFFDPLDLSANNNRDIIYLDSYPGLVSSSGARRDPDELLQTAAHEYQHLIHAAYDRSELSFVNEGLSEWAEVMNGYTARGIGYLSSLSELRETLLEWREFGGPSNFDYQRAGLLTDYLAEQIGVDNAGRLTQSRERGADGYAAALQGFGIDLKQLVAGFHVANSVNDASLTNPAGTLRYGYLTQQYQFVSAAPRETFDGATVLRASVTAPPSMAPGSVDYYRFENVANFSVSLDVTASGNVGADRVLLRPHVVLEGSDGSRSVAAFDPNGDDSSFSGSFSRVTLVIPHVDLKSTRRPSYAFDASWSASNPGFETQAVSYDDGTVHIVEQPNTIEAYAFSGSGSANFDAQSKAANRFDVPAGGVLSRVDVAPMFAREFGVQTASQVKDYTLYVWSEVNGEPGDVLFSVDRTDTRATSLGDFPKYSFDSISLGNHAGQLTGLPTPIYVGIGNAGTDDNHLYMPVSSFAGNESPSFFELNFGGSSGWGAFARLETSSGDKPLAERVLPIRAFFVVPVGTAAESDVTLPEEVTLTQNYPNPFNPQTTVAFSLPSATQVRLAVFDLLGREVAVLADGRMPAGTHEAVFDGTKLTSGVYLYALDANGARQTRTMLLIK